MDYDESIENDYDENEEALEVDQEAYETNEEEERRRNYGSDDDSGNESNR